MADDPRDVLMKALVERYVSDHNVVRLKSNGELADAVQAALTAAGWRLVRDDDLRWMLDNLNLAAFLFEQGPPGVWALLGEMDETEDEPTESDGELLVEGDR